LNTASNSTSLRTPLANIERTCDICIEGNIIYIAAIRKVSFGKELVISLRTAETHKKLSQFSIHCSETVENCSLCVLSNTCYVYTLETIGEASCAQVVQFTIYCVQSQGTDWILKIGQKITVYGFPLTATYSRYIGMRGYAFPSSLNTASNPNHPSILSTVEHRLVFGLRDTNDDGSSCYPSIAVRVQESAKHTFIDVAENNSSVIQSDKGIVFDKVTGNMVLLGPNYYQPTSESQKIPFPTGIEVWAHAYPQTVLRQGVLSVGDYHKITLFGLDCVYYKPVTLS